MGDREELIDYAERAILLPAGLPPHIVALAEAMGTREHLVTIEGKPVQPQIENLLSLGLKKTAEVPHGADGRQLVFRSEEGFVIRLLTYWREVPCARA